MEKLVFAFDLGIASVGWAAVRLNESDHSGRILKAGAHTFRAAELRSSQGAPKSICEDRRKARSTRRTLRRKALRMKDLRNLLKRQGLPENPVDIDPYQCRLKGLDHQLTPKEWSRALLHIAKHRGPRPSKKELAEISIGKLPEGSAEEKEKGAQIQAMRNNALRVGLYRTAGEMLAKDPYFKFKKRNSKEDYSHTIARTDHENEIKVLFEVQRNLGNPAASKEFERAFLERMLSQRSFDQGNNTYSMIGYCTFEREEKRAAKSTWTFERFLLLEKVNHLRWSCSGTKPQMPSQDQREAIIKEAYKTKDVTYKKVRKILNLEDDARFHGLHYKSGEDNEKKVFISLSYWHSLKKLVKNESLNLSEDEQEQMMRRHDWQDHIGTIITYYKDEKEVDRQIRLSGIPSKYDDFICLLSGSRVGHLSLKALKEILPAMEQGATYFEAVTDSKYGSVDRPKPEERKRLLPVIDDQEFTNPVVMRTLSRARKILNALIREYGSPHRISIEMARDLGRSAKDRYEIEKGMSQFKKEKDALRAQFKKDFRGDEPKGKMLLKYRLWKEQNGRCLYSGDYIDPARLSEEGYCQVDHIIPISRSMDDSLNNKTLCKTKSNQEKGNCIPAEWLDSDSEAWTEYKARVNACKQIRQAKKNRLLKLELTQEDADQFISRNLNDTRNANVYFKNFIEDNLLFEGDESVPVRCVNGAVTSFLRAQWGLLKERSTSDRHHALDAMVIACVTQGLVQRITRYMKRRECRYFAGSDPNPKARAVNLETGEEKLTRYSDVRHEFPVPWEGFPGEVSERLRDVFVVRTPRRKWSGEIHGGSVYRKKDAENGFFSTRKLLTDLTLDDLENLIDKDGRNQSLYEALKARLDAAPRHEGGKMKGLPNAKEAFKEPFYFSPQALAAGRKSRHLVKKVRICQNGGKGIAIREGLAKNAGDSMVRIDVYEKKGEHFFVPVYRHHFGKEIPRHAVPTRSGGDWILIDKNYSFKFSLYKDELIKIKRKGKEPVVGYFVGANISNSSVDLMLPDRSESKVNIGIRRTECFEKYHVDLLGNVSLIKKRERLSVFPNSSS